MNTNISDIIVVLPLGAHEQHGPHLPPETDTIIATELAQRLVESTKSVQLKILETEPIGYSIEHLDFPETKSLEYQEAIERWLSIIEREQKLGHKKFLLLNAHGGNSPLLTIVATEARIRWNILVVVTHWTRFGLPDALSDQIDKSLDIHAGEIETSMILSINSNLVKLNNFEDYKTKQADYINKYKYLRAYGQHAFGWKMQDLNEKGAVGNVKNATAEKGKLIFDHAVAGLTDLIADMSAFDMSEFS